MGKSMAWGLMIGLVVSAGLAGGYPVGPALGLDELTEEADVIFKGTALATEPVQDEWFSDYPGFAASETRFEAVSAIKGELPGDTVAFRHYEPEGPPYSAIFEPQNYRFEDGRAYLVFARTGGPDGALRQLWMYHKIKDDQGVVLCADAAPVAGKNVGDVIWAELTAMLQGRDTDKAAYAIRQLDQMSGGGVLFDNLSDFDRREVVDRVKGLMVHRDEAIAQAAVRVVGTHNPYMSAERTLHWLATVGSATVPGVGKMDPHMQNVGAKMCEDELTAVTRGTGSNETRGLAIRALGLVGDRALLGPIERWLADRSPDVRAAATVLLADFPGAETRRRLTALAGDPAPEVRAAVAEAAGFAQEAGLADVLAGLLGDRERKVREAAAMSLLSFSPDDETIAAIFRANLDDEEFEPLFLLALAREEPGDYLDGLAGAVEQKTEPESFWGGQIPAFTAWEILFRFLQAQPVEEVTSGRLDRYLDAMEKVGNYSSSPPRDIYAFYLQRGMTARAQAFRKKAAAAASYDLDYFFNMVDENPGLYTRQ